MTTEPGPQPPHTEALKYPFPGADRMWLHPNYADLRASGGLVRIQMPYGDEAWLATKYHDLRLVMNDVRFQRAAPPGVDEPRLRPEPVTGGIISMDPPDHTRLRKLVATAFTHRTVTQLRPRAEQIADQLVDAMIATGPPVDFVNSFAIPMTVQVICELLGVPSEDYPRFRVWTDAFVSSSGLSRDEIQQSIGELTGYIGALIADRRQRPNDDLISRLVQARDVEDRLSEVEMLRLIVGLLVAGHETTESQMPSFLYLLMSHPDQFTLLREHPELMPQAIEELMRFSLLFVSASFARYPKEDIEIGGVRVRAGEPVLAAINPANRDPDVFQDPDRLDITRTDNPHVGFGHGSHYCLGAQLARMEFQVAISTIMRRLPDVRFAVPEDQLKWRSGIVVRGLAELPITW